MNKLMINRLKEMILHYECDQRNHQDQRDRDQRDQRNQQGCNSRLRLLNTLIDKEIEGLAKMHAVRMILYSDAKHTKQLMTDLRVDPLTVIYFANDQHGSLEVLIGRGETKLKTLCSIRAKHTKPDLPTEPCEHEFVDFDSIRFCHKCGEEQEHIPQSPFPLDHDDHRLDFHLKRSDEIPITPPDLDDIDLESMTHKKLKKLAKDSGMKYTSQMSNETLFARLGLPPEANRMKSTKPTGVTLTNVKTGEKQSLGSLSEVARMSGKERGSIHYHIKKGKELVIDGQAFLVTRDQKTD